MSPFLVRDASTFDVEAALAELASEGFARLGLALNEEGLFALRERADDIMLGRTSPEPFFYQHDSETGRYEDLSRREGFTGPSAHYRKIEKLERDPLFRAWIGNPLFERITSALAPKPIMLYRAVLFNKAAKGGTSLPWHQDGGSFWGLDRPPLVQIWTTFDDASIESGCLEIVPGSHRAGLATPLGGVIPDEVIGPARAEERSIKVPAKAGEVILIHNDVWHRSGTNATENPRRALTVCYLRGDTRCTRKRKAPRVFPTIFEAQREPSLALDQRSALE